MTMIQGAAGIPLVFVLMVAAGTARGDEESDPFGRQAVQKDAARAAERAAPAGNRPLVWLDSLAKGTVDARQSERPIFLRAGGENCRFCRALEEELNDPDLQAELKRWTLVNIDVDESPADARRMGVDAIPALRILTPAGKLVASRDGFLQAAALTSWLKKEFAAASVVPPEALFTEGPPDPAAVSTLIREFRNRDAAIREAAVRRLIPHPGEAAQPVVSAFSSGTLATRLAALDLLQEWHAPIEGIDPWRPETLTAERLRSLADWAGAADRAAGAPAREKLSDEEVTLAGELISRLVAAPADEARAIQERLARYGRWLLPLVYQRLRESTGDSARERLTALRYRLVAPESLALGWSGGIERLASRDVETRFRAAEELFRRATLADEALLLELFSDPAPLVRELSLRSLHAIGGTNADSALIRLLEDPEPNVRVAVLNQLAESPSRTIVPRIAEFAARETDPDIVVHAIRVLREAKGQTASEALMKLLSHESWQVRAEAVEGLGKFIDRHASQPEPLAADIYAAMVELLDDADGFVVSRAVAVLGAADLIAAVDPLAKAAEVHPELAKEVVAALTHGNQQRPKSLVHLRRLSEHSDARLRAAAVGALCTIQDDGIETRLDAALKDPELQVRLAAAGGFFQMLQRYRPQVAIPAEPADAAEPVMVIEEQSVGFFGGIIRKLVGGSGPVAPATRRAPAPKAGRAVQREAPAAPIAEDGPANVEPTTPGGAAAGPTTGAPDADDASVNDQTAADQYEAQLAAIRTGTMIEKKWLALAAPLESLLASPLSEERLAAALPLVALGRDEAALPELLRLAKSEQRLTGRLAEALPWLPSADRRKLFAELVAGASSADQLDGIAGQMSRIRTPGAADDLWSLLELPWIDATSAEVVRSHLVQFYYPDHYFNPWQAPPRAQKRVIAAATPRAESGPHWRRITALALLMPLEGSNAAGSARAMVANESLIPAERADAFQVLLMSEPEEAATKSALEHLSGAVPELGDVALSFLTRGIRGIGSLREGRFHVHPNYYLVEPDAVPTGQPIVPEPPTGLRPEPLEPLLGSPNRRVAAQAGYLLALLERPEGRPPLVEYWQSSARDDVAWMRLVYRAVVRLDDGAQVPILKEIYARLNTDHNRHALGEFYWTIRSMTHPDVLAFRKQIRQEIGMDQLR